MVWKAKKDNDIYFNKAPNRINRELEFDANYSTPGQIGTRNIGSLKTQGRKGKSLASDGSESSMSVIRPIGSSHRLGNYRYKSQIKGGDKDQPNNQNAIESIKKIVQQSEKKKLFVRRQYLKKNDISFEPKSDFNTFNSQRDDQSNLDPYEVIPIKSEAAAYQEQGTKLPMINKFRAQKLVQEQ